eukprot:SAG11_NODE_11786_length_738_cov_1.065728_2_plen_47_part_01
MALFVPFITIPYAARWCCTLAPLPELVKARDALLDDVKRMELVQEQA